MIKKYTRVLLSAFFVILFVLTNGQIVTYTFTNANATGANGPTQAQINAAYLSTNLNGSVTASSGIQSWTVPTSGLYHIDVSGASGGNAPTYAMTGGLGARMQGLFNLNSGQVLQILVGQVGENGCGNSGGGGGSYVVNTGTLLIAAGGGGGCTSQINGVNGSTLTSGTQDNPAVSNGGTGGNGGNSCQSSSYNGGGGGGYNAGAAGNGQTGSNGGGGGLSFLNGGTGGAGHLNSQVGPAGGFGGGGGGSYCTVGGGGGGGYSGGAGGQHLNTCIGNSFRTGGGGGGSFNSAASQTNTAAFQIGNGRVLITRLCYITMGTTTGANMVCLGSAITLTTDAISSYTWSNGSNLSSITVTPAVNTTYSLTAMSVSNCIASAAITITVSNSPPVLSINSSTNSVCLGNSVSIAASGALSYTFSGGISNNVAFIPSLTTTYSIQGQNGCGTSSAATTISVSALPVTAITSSSIVCAGSTATLSAGGANTYSWSPGNLTGAIVSVNTQSATTYTVVGSLGNCLGVNTVVINTNPNPTITAAASNSIICGGQSVTLTATGALGYTWQPGNLVGASVVVNPSSPTGFVVIGHNSFGCTSTAQQPVVAFASPTINIISSTPTVCAGGSALLYASGANTYTWSNGPNTSSISVNPVSATIYTVAGTNTISQCSSSSTFAVNVLSPSITLSSSSAICVGSSATIIASGADSYQWSTGATSSSIVVIPPANSSYTVTGLVNAGSISCSATAATSITVNPLPAVSAVASRVNICKNESTILTGTGGISYVWSNSATTASISVSPTINTTYSVIGTDANGCSNSGSIFIRVYGCVGLDEQIATSDRIQIFPNPGKEEITITSETSMDILIINELGQIIEEINLHPNNRNKVLLKNLRPGVYFVQAKDPQLKLNKKLIIQ